MASDTRGAGVKRAAQVRIRGIRQMVMPDQMEFSEEEPEITEVFAEGSYMQKGSAKYLFYESMEEDGSLVSNRIKMDGERIEVTRKGQHAAYLVYEPGRVHPCVYDTPMGMIPLTLITNEVAICEKEEELQAKLAYELWMEEDKLTENTLEIMIRLQ